MARTVRPVPVVVHDEDPPARHPARPCSVDAAAGPPGVAATTGRVTVNVLPWPSPSLAAVTVPPCISTSPLTSASPMPSPPVVRSTCRSTCENMSKMVGSDSAGMPMPVSRTDTTTASSATLGGQPDRARPARCTWRCW